MAQIADMGMRIIGNYLARVRMSGSAVLASVALVALGIALASYLRDGISPGDALNYLAAGERLNAGHDLYALGPGDRPVDIRPPYWTVPLLSPPLVAVLFRPLALLPWPIGAYLWWSLTATSVGIVLVWSASRRPALAGLVVIILIVPLMYEASTGNLNGLILLGACLMWRSTAAGRDGWAGALAVAGVLLKVSPLPLAWWLLTSRGWAPVKGAVVAVVVLGAVSLLGAGMSAHLTFFTIARDTATAGLSDLSLGGIARALGLSSDVATRLQVSGLVGGLLGILAMRQMPESSFRLATVTMTLASPVVNVDSYSLLAICLAPAVWPLGRRGNDVELSPQEASTLEPKTLTGASTPRAGNY